MARTALAAYARCSTDYGASRDDGRRKDVTSMSYVVLAVLVGALLGFVASMLPLPPFARCALGGTAAYVVGSAIRLVGWLLHATDESGIAAASASAMYVMVALVAVWCHRDSHPVCWLGWACQSGSTATRQSWSGVCARLSAR